MNKHRKTLIKLDELNIRGCELLFEQLILRANTILSATMILFLSSLSIFRSDPFSGRSFTLYSFFLNYHDRTLFHHLSPHLSICPISHLLWLFWWMVVVETVLFRGILHINAIRKVTAVYLMRWWQFLLPDISIFLSSLHVPEVHPYRWILLEGHLNFLNICLIDILCIRGV